MALLLNIKPELSAKIGKAGKASGMNQEESSPKG
jgi:hypothetical protein